MILVFEIAAPTVILNFYYIFPTILPLSNDVCQVKHAGSNGGFPYKTGHKFDLYRRPYFLEDFSNLQADRRNKSSISNTSIYYINV